MLILVAESLHFDFVVYFQDDHPSLHHGVTLNKVSTRSGANFAHNNNTNIHAVSIRVFRRAVFVPTNMGSTRQSSL